MRASGLAAALAGAALAVAGIYAVGAHTPAAPSVVQGDTLGRQPGESEGEYEARARASLSESPDPSFALVTFRNPLAPVEAARAVAPVERVSGLLPIDAPLKPIPEPPAGETRADVFAREAEREADAGRANGVALDASEIAAVVVRADGRTLSELAAEPEVAAVEALPADAVWGTFGVSPVTSA